MKPSARHAVAYPQEANVIQHDVPQTICLAAPTLSGRTKQTECLSISNLPTCETWDCLSWRVDSVRQPVWQRSGRSTQYSGVAPGAVGNQSDLSQRYKEGRPDRKSMGRRGKGCRVASFTELKARIFG